MGNAAAGRRAVEVVTAAGEIALALVLAAATAFGVVWRRRNGRLRAVRPSGAATGAAPPRLTEAELGTPLGRRATLLQFSSRICAPCRATRALLADVAGAADGVTHVELGVEDHLDLVRQLGVLRTPTVFVLDPHGRIAQQASGQPRRADLLAAVASVTGPLR